MPVSNNLNKRTLNLRNFRQLVDTNEPLVNIASIFGIPTPMRDGEGVIARLEVKDKDQGHRNSLTSRHGKGRFPFHTDGAHLAIVPRYVLMRLAAKSWSIRPTELVDVTGCIAPDERRTLETERWKFSSGRKSICSTILSESGLRYDPAIMKPAVASLTRSQEIIEGITDAAFRIRIHWKQGELLIIDNHRMIHARGSANVINENRVLERIAVLQS